jgi:hypothetical protein
MSIKSTSKQRLPNQAFDDGWDNMKWNSGKQDNEKKVQEAYKELRKATDNYRKAKLLNKGSKMANKKKQAQKKAPPKKRGTKRNKGKSY